MTYVALANITLGSSASSVTFSSIPATFRDLVIVSQWSNSANANLTMRANSDSGSNYTRVYAFGFSGGVLSGTESGTSWNSLTLSSGGSTQLMTLQIMDYSATDKHKTALMRCNQADPYITADALRWANTSAITSFSLTAGAGSISAGSTFALYGIAS